MTTIEEKKLSDLKPDQANANRGTDRGRAMLESSLRQWGAGRSILLDREGRIIAGNKTYEEAGQIGLEDVVIVRTQGDKLVAVLREDLDLSDDATGARELAYADNRVGQVSLDWEPEQVLADLDAGLNLGQFWNEGELNAILAGLETEPKPDPGPQVDKAAQLAEKWGTQTGQVWQLGAHRLAVGDCTDKAVVEAVMRGERADCMIADPPYGKLKIFNSDGAVGNAGSNLAQVQHYGSYKGEGDFSLPSLLEVAQYDKAIIWGGNNFTDILPVTQSWLIWDKRAGENNLFYAECELAWSNLGITAKVFDYVWQGMIREGEKIPRCHPTQKPVPLYRWCLGLIPKAEMIYDPTLGSGSSLIACEQLKRKCRAIEIDPGYCGVAIQRWADLTGQEPTLL